MTHNRRSAQILAIRLAAYVRLKQAKRQESDERLRLAKARLCQRRVATSQDAAAYWAAAELHESTLIEFNAIEPVMSRVERQGENRHAFD